MPSPRAPHAPALPGPWCRAGAPPWVGAMHDATPSPPPVSDLRRDALESRVDARVQGARTGPLHPATGSVPGQDRNPWASPSGPGSLVVQEEDGDVHADEARPGCQVGLDEEEGDPPEPPPGL